MVFAANAYHSEKIYFAFTHALLPIQLWRWYWKKQLNIIGDEEQRLQIVSDKMNDGWAERREVGKAEDSLCKLRKVFACLYHVKLP